MYNFLNINRENIYYSPKTQLLRTFMGELKINKTTAFKSPEKLHEALVGFPYDNSSVIGIEFNGSWTEWPDKLSFALRAPIRSVLDVNDMFLMAGSPLYLTSFLSVQQALSQAHIMHKCKQLNKCQGNMTFPEFKDLPTPPIYGTEYSIALRAVAQLLIQIIIFFVVISLTKVSTISKLCKPYHPDFHILSVTVYCRRKGAPAQGDTEPIGSWFQFAVAGMVRPELHSALVWIGDNNALLENRPTESGHIFCAQYPLVGRPVYTAHPQPLYDLL